jgi:hypothetical protein
MPTSSMVRRPQPCQTRRVGDDLSTHVLCATAARVAVMLALAALTAVAGLLLDGRSCLAFAAS